MRPTTFRRFGRRPCRDRDLTLGGVESREAIDTNFSSAIAEAIPDFPAHHQTGIRATAKGYLREFFEDAFGRYLPAVTHIPDFDPSHPSPANVYAGEMHFSTRNQEGAGYVLKSQELPMFTQVVTPVTGQKPEYASQQENGDGKPNEIEVEI